jgi:hypothetical protein
LEIKVKLYDVEAVLDQEGAWHSDDKGVETILESLIDAMPVQPSMKHPLVLLASWEMEVLGGKVISVEDDQILRQDAVY